MTNREHYTVVVTHMNRQLERIKKQLRDTRNVAMLEEITREQKDALACLGELVRNANTAQGIEQGGLFNTQEYEAPVKRVRNY